MTSLGLGSNLIGGYNERVAFARKLLNRLLREDIRLKAELSSPSWRVRIDPGQLDQIILNLAINARDAMPNGGALTIRTRQVTIAEPHVSPSFSIVEGDYVVLEVSDTGIGMDSETKRRVFEPFFTTKGETQGSGLGLATCYGIVQEANGGIFIDTELGRGSTFRVYLPRTERVACESNVAPDEIAQGARVGETVLVCEDEARVRRIMLQVLRAVGYMVLESASVAQAVHVARESPSHIDLLLTDLILPDGTGGDVANRVLELRPETRVLYVSGYTNDPALRKGIAEGELQFLAKPFTARQLVQRAREVIDASPGSAPLASNARKPPERAQPPSPVRQGSR